jgi:hypothetical protein
MLQKEGHHIGLPRWYFRFHRNLSQKFSIEKTRMIQARGYPIIGTMGIECGDIVIRHNLDLSPRTTRLVIYHEQHKLHSIDTGGGTNNDPYMYAIGELKR